MDAHLLAARIRELARGAGFKALSVAVQDFQDGARFEIEPDRWFHAASVIKVAVLLALLHAVDEGRARLEDSLHVRNRFLSVIDSSVFRIDRDRDGDAECHRCVGASMKLGALAKAMIVRSSNLATNLLLDFLGLEAVRQSLAQGGIEGVKIVRGVEDHVAFERGLNNQMTARGAVDLFSKLCGNAWLSDASRRVALEILLAQEFNAMIPARLPSRVKVAHKTGEISTHCHDAGVVFCPDRAPYVIAIFGETPPGLEHRSRVLAEVSALLFNALTQ